MTPRTRTIALLTAGAAAFVILRRHRQRASASAAPTVEPTVETPATKVEQINEQARAGAKTALAKLHGLLEAEIGGFASGLIVSKIERWIDDADAVALAGRLGAGKIARVLAEQSPELVAEILHVLPDTFADDVLARLPERLQRQVVTRLEHL